MAAICWPSTGAFISALLSLLLFLPLSVVSLIDIRRLRNSERQPAFLEMNMPAPRPLFGGQIAQALDGVAGLAGWLELAGIVLTAIVGLAFSGYVALQWLTHLVGHGQYVVALVIALLGVLLIGAAAVRIPLALIVLFGGATCCGVAFLLGYGHVVLP